MCDSFGLRVKLYVHCWSGGGGALNTDVVLVDPAVFDGVVVPAGGDDDDESLPGPPCDPPGGGGGGWSVACV